jgi:hypothetical protein
MIFATAGLRARTINFRQMVGSAAERSVGGGSGDDGDDVAGVTGGRGSERRREESCMRRRRSVQDLDACTGPAVVDT